MKLRAQVGRIHIVSIALLVAGVASLALFHGLRSTAFGEYQIPRTVTPDEAATRSAAIVQQAFGQDVSGYTRTTAWADDGYVGSFLEQGLGIEQTEAVANDGFF